jgi:hypothetical protein
MRLLLFSLTMAVCAFAALMMAEYGVSAFATDDYFPLHIGDEWRKRQGSAE